jgi:archaellum biogenesis ATPase FlaH
MGSIQGGDELPKVSQEAFQKEYWWWGQLDSETRNGISKRAEAEAIDEFFSGLRESPNDYLLALESKYSKLVSTNRRIEFPSVLPLSELRQIKTETAIPIIADTLNEDETVLLIGASKIGKSALSQQLAVSMASGVPCLNNKIMKVCRVFYVDLENQPQHVKSRLQALCVSIPGYDWQERLFVASYDTLAQNVFSMHPEGFKYLSLAVEEFKPDVMIIDPLRLFGAGDLNDAQVVVRFLKKISELRQIRPGLTIIIVHHLRKEDRKSKLKLREAPEQWIEEASGSQALIAHVDSIWGLEMDRDGGQDSLTLAMVRRNGFQRTLFLGREIDAQGDPVFGFQLLSNFDIQSAIQRIFTEKQMVCWNQLAQNFTWRDLVTACAGSKCLASAILSRAKSNLLIMGEEGSYQKSPPAAREQNH